MPGDVLVTACERVPAHKGLPTRKHAFLKKSMNVTFGKVQGTVLLLNTMVLNKYQNWALRKSVKAFFFFLLCFNY